MLLCIIDDAGVAQLVQRGAMEWTTGVRFPMGTRDISPPHSIQSSSGVHPPSYLMGTRGLSQVIKRLGRKADHSLISSANVKNDGNITPLPHMSSCRGVKLSRGTTLRLLYKC
jgi:hypothetical protein